MTHTLDENADGQPDYAAVEIPSQVAYPVQAILRTVVQALVGALFALLVVALPDAASPLAQAQAPLVDLVMVALTTAGASAAAWLMSRPLINRWLAKIGLGAIPRVCNCSSSSWPAPSLAPGCTSSDRETP